MQKIMCTTTLVLFLLVAGGSSALAAPVTTAPAPADAASQNLESALSQLYQLQQNVVDQLEAARLQQVLALIQAGQPADVEFAGMLQPAGVPGQWAVAGLFLGQTSATVFEGLPVAGLHAHVRARIHSDGTVEALRVRTMTHASQSAGWQHMTQWMQDDYGIHMEAWPQQYSVQMATPLPSQPVATPHPSQPRPGAPQQWHQGDGCSNCGRDSGAGHNWGGSHDSGHGSGHR